MATIKTVGVFNASEDTVAMLCELLRLDGFQCVSAHVAQIKRGELDFPAFIATNDPQAIIWDISPPYDENWKFFKLIQSSDALRGRGVVLTTTHKPHLDRLAGEDTGAIEIVGKPYDLAEILGAARRAIAACQAEGTGA